MKYLRKILIGSDRYGFQLKENVKKYLVVKGFSCIDIGVGDDSSTDLYPDIAMKLATLLIETGSDRGILICGTGIGMALVANKIPGVRAACVHDPYSAERARKSNDAQIITFGAQIVGISVVQKLLDHWLESEFDGGRSTPKVERIKEIDLEFRKMNT